MNHEQKSVRSRAGHAWRAGAVLAQALLLTGCALQAPETTSLAAPEPAALRASVAPLLGVAPLREPPAPPLQPLLAALETR